MISLWSTGHWKALAGLGLNGLVQSLSLLYFMTRLRDHVIDQQSNLSEQWLLLLLLAGILTATRFIERAGSEHLALTHIHGMRNRIFEHFLCLPTQSARRINRGGLLMRLTGDLGAIRTWIIQGLVPSMTLAVWMSVGCISLLLLDPALVTLLLVLLAAALPIYWTCGRALYRTSGNVRQQRARLISFATEKIAGVSLIQSMNQTGRESRRFRRLSQRLLSQQKRRALWIGLLRALTELTSILLVGTLALAGYYRIESGPLTTDQFVMITVFGLYLLPQLRRLGRVYEYWTLYSLSCHKLERFMNRKPGKTDGTRLKTATGAPISIQVQLPGSPLLQAPAGSKVMLHDPMKAVLPLLKQAFNGETVPQKSTVVLQGIPVEQLSATEIKRRFVIIDSNIQLWAGSLKHNLTYGMRRGKDKELQQALEVCGLLPLVQNMTEGLETRIKPYAHPFSDQECFAIQLCRALLRKPSLILIDHPSIRQSLAQSQLMAGVAEYFKGTLIVSVEDLAEATLWINTFWNICEPQTPGINESRDHIDA